MSKKEKKKSYERSHRVVFFFVKILSFLFTRIFRGYRCRDNYKIKRGESVLVLSNHQTDIDPFLIFTSFNKPVYPVATDNIFAGRFRGKLFSALGLIPKKKGFRDLRSVIKMNERLAKGGSVMLFPEGNRYYAEFQYYITDKLPKYIKSTNATLVLFNIHGGSGTAPRFKNRNRRGKFYGQIKLVLTPEQYKEMSDKELLDAITENLRVYDSDFPYRYKSRRRAEYLERMFFVCPSCGSFETVRSEREYVFCTNCGAKAEYGEDLRFHDTEKGFGVARLIDWWDIQKKAVCKKEIVPGEVIFSDVEAKLVSTVPFEKRELVDKGSLILTDTALTCGNTVFDLTKINAASVVSGRNLTFLYDKKDYTLRGGKRFNPIKYVYMFNLLDTAMRRSAADHYFNPEE